MFSLLIPEKRQVAYMLSLPPKQSAAARTMRPDIRFGNRKEINS